jgi:hypothetical protein
MDLEICPRYDGFGWAELGEPTIRIGGPTVVTMDSNGRPYAVLTVSEIPTSESFESGLTRLSRDMFEGINSGSRHCTLRVESPDGVFSATEQTFRQSSVDFSRMTATVQFFCGRAYLAKGNKPAKYWRLPIWNFHGILKHASWTRNVEHPLRSSLQNPLSPFEFHGQIGFVEVVPDYEKFSESRKDGDRTPRITAAIVGVTAGDSTTWSDLQTWFPFDYLNLLGLSSGCRVGSPWIEFFDESIALVGRMHVTTGTDVYEPGQSLLDDMIHRGGIGRLFTCAASSTRFSQKYLRVAVNQMLMSLRNGQGLEDKFSHVSRSLDALIEYHGLASQYLLEEADENVRSSVNRALGTARDAIQSLAREQVAVGEASLAAALDKIAERTTSNPANMARDFGLAVISLLDAFHLHDAEAVQAFYVANPRPDGRRWHQVLSHYRGISQHGDTFSFGDNTNSIFEVYRLANHLADIVARVVLKQLNYDGEYLPTNLRWAEKRELDWVRADTPALQLGYGMRDAT